MSTSAFFMRVILGSVVPASVLLIEPDVSSANSTFGFICWLWSILPKNTSVSSAAACRGAKNVRKVAVAIISDLTDFLAAISGRIENI